jgi:hypothetical protein
VTLYFGSLEDVATIVTAKAPRNEAEVLARVTGAREATYRVERRDPATGEIVVESETTWKRDAR